MEVELDGKRIGELLRSGEAAGKYCFVGATPPPIYSKTGSHLLEGYANRDCDSYGSFEERLIQAQADRPPKSENSQYLQRVEFDSQGRIELTTACRLILAESNATAVEKILKRAAEGLVERFVFVNGALRAITEDQASASNILDYYRAQTLSNRTVQIYRISKKPIGTQKWFYDAAGKLVDTKFEAAAPAE